MEGTISSAVAIARGSKDRMDPRNSFRKCACTLIPDSSEKLKDILRNMERIRDELKPSEGAGRSFTEWLHDMFGPSGATAVQVLIPVSILFILILCFCAVSFKYMKPLKSRWMGTVVGGTSQQTVKHIYVYTDYTEKSGPDQCDDPHSIAQKNPHICVMV